jgi:hypothetical protein
LKRQDEWQPCHEGINIVGKPLLEKQANSGCSQQGNKTAGKLQIFNSKLKGGRTTRTWTLWASQFMDCKPQRSRQTRVLDIADELPNF